MKKELSTYYLFCLQLCTQLFQPTIPNRKSIDFLLIVSADVNVRVLKKGECVSGVIRNLES
jgi:hypothetical protein